MHTVSKSKLEELAKTVLRAESTALLDAADQITEDFSMAVEIIVSREGRLLLTGLGKSGHIAQKIASTMASTGTPSSYIHPSEALHGDFGMLTSNDILLAVTYGGETREVMAVAMYAKEMGLPVIAITGVMSSSLAKISNVVLNGTVKKEADTLGLAPTASSTVALGLGDSLAVALMNYRGFTKEGFAKLHPGGQLGRALLRVENLMHPIEDLPFVGLKTGFHDILKAVTSPNFGIAAVMSEPKKIAGSISDGDLRRALLAHGGEALNMVSAQLMNKNPKMITASAQALEALALMETNKVTSLFVTEGSKTNLMGIIRLHDLMAAKVI